MINFLFYYITFLFYLFQNSVEINLYMYAIDICDRIGSYYPLCHRSRNDPIDPWAFIRVKNEIALIETSLNSIYPAIRRGIIGYTQSTDGTEEKILEFCKTHPGFIPFKYEYDVLPAGSEQYLTGRYNEKQSVASFYNAVLEHIPIGDWLIKIDADQIYDTEKLRMALFLPESDKAMLSLSRMNLHYKNNELKIVLTGKSPFVDPHDQWLIKRTKDLHFKMEIRPKTLESWELLYPLDAHYIMHTDCFIWHFPFMKAWRSDDQWKYASFRTSAAKYLGEYPIPDDMLDEGRILDLLFRYTNKSIITQRKR